MTRRMRGEPIDDGAAPRVARADGYAATGGPRRLQDRCPDKHGLLSSLSVPEADREAAA